MKPFIAAVLAALPLATNVAGAEPPHLGGLARRGKASPRISGAVLISELGCAACHASETPLTDSVPPGPVAEKYSAASLAAFFEDPLAARPGVDR